MSEFDLSLMVHHLIQLDIAVVLSLSIALNREMKDKGARLRTVYQYAQKVIEYLF